MGPKLVLLFLSSAVLILSSATADSVGVSARSRDEVTEVDKVTPEPRPEVGEEDNNGTEPAYYDGIDLNTLDENEIQQLMDAEDEIMQGELDIYGYKNALAMKSKRPKRWISLVARGVFALGRVLFRSFSRGRITRSGSRLTRQYNTKGSFSDANRVFNKLNPTNVKHITNGKLQGRTGTMGKHRVTVRNTSSNGRPTLEIRTLKSQGSLIRKFRFNEK